MKTAGAFLFLIFVATQVRAHSPKTCRSPLKEYAASPLSYADTDLFKIYSEELKILKSSGANEETLSSALQIKNKLEFQNLKKRSPSRGVKIEVAEALLKSIASHPVVSAKALLRYDPTSQTGFCFGRAAYVHIELMRAGATLEDVVKIFVMGGLYVDDIGWDYHVATAVRSEQGAWLVIDSLFDKVLTIDDWMYEVAKWDADKVHPKVRFYATNAAKFQPTIGSYESQTISSVIYQKYFEDLTNWYARRDSCTSFLPVKN